MNLAELYIPAEVILIVNRAMANKLAIEYELWAKGQRVLNGDFSIQEQVDQVLLNYASSIKHAYTIARAFDVHDSLSVKSIELRQQKDALLFMFLLMGDIRPWFRITFFPRTEQDWGALMVAPYVLQVVIGQFRLQAAFAVIAPTMTRKSSSANAYYSGRRMG